MGPVRLPSKATIDFSEYDDPHGAGTIRVTLGYLKAVKVGAGRVVENVPWTSPVIPVTDDDTGTDVAAKVFAAIPRSTLDCTGLFHSQGYDASRDPTTRKIVLNGYYDAKDKPHDVTKPQPLAAGATPTPRVEFVPARVP
jgi:hypothetical protein